MEGNLFWFLRESWRYLGCDHGTGRWRARRRFFRKGWASYRTFRRLRREDARHGL